MTTRPGDPPFDPKKEVPTLPLGPFIRSPYNYNRDAESDITGLLCQDESMAQQQFKEESDINEIVRRFGLTGTLPENPRLPVSGDFTGVTDYQTALNAVLQAEESFMELPAHVRAAFNNNPQQLLEFIEDPANIPKARELGLLKPVPPAPADPPPPSSPGKPNSGL